MRILGGVNIWKVYSFQCAKGNSASLKIKKKEGKVTKKDDHSHGTHMRSPGEAGKSSDSIVGKETNEHTWQTDGLRQRQFADFG